MESGETYHIRRGKITHDKLVIPLFNLLCHFLRHAMCRHFRLLVVGGNFGAGDELAVFTIKLLLDTAIEEEGYVGILFGF